ALLSDTARARDTLLALRRLGVKVALDDCGTGYSSLSYLTSFALDKVKIDRSCIRETDSDDRRLTLLRGIARIAADLGLRVTVEGVETERQLLLLAGCAIDEIQGYLFSRPVPVSELPALFDRFAPASPAARLTA
ncbi:MAG: EAL domain-containing protein, partial [Methylobacteriaceae bacterium]|nr:EAL domain-containing protein [Methylobacteriaceae bacterium]